MTIKSDIGLQFAALFIITQNSDMCYPLFCTVIPVYKILRSIYTSDYVGSMLPFCYGFVRFLWFWRCIQNDCIERISAHRLDITMISTFKHTYIDAQLRALLRSFLEKTSKKAHPDPETAWKQRRLRRANQKKAHIDRGQILSLRLQSMIKLIRLSCIIRLQPIL